MYFKYKIEICILNIYQKYLYLKYYPALFTKWYYNVLTLSSLAVM